MMNDLEGAEHRSDSNGNGHDHAGSGQGFTGDEPHQSTCSPTPHPPTHGGRLPAWKQRLHRARTAIKQRLEDEAPSGPPLASDRQIVYVLDLPATAATDQGLIIELGAQDVGNDETLQPVKPLRLAHARLPDLPEPDRQILHDLAGAERADVGYSRSGFGEISRRYLIPPAGYLTTLKSICLTGRAAVRREREDRNPHPLHWDEGRPWEFWVDLAPTEEPEIYQLRGALRRENSSPDDDTDAIDVAQTDLVLPGGLVVAHGRAAALRHFGAFDLLKLLRESGQLIIPQAHLEDLVHELYAMPCLPRLNLPEALRLEEVRVTPVPHLNIRQPRGKSDDDRLNAELSFQYDDRLVAADADAGTVLQPQRKRAIVRDRDAERQAFSTLQQLGFRADSDLPAEAPRYRLPPAKLTKAVLQLVASGWVVEADGKLYRRAGDVKLQVSSGIDWFDLSGQLRFGDQTIPLPRLLEAIRRGSSTVRLDDGTIGLVPEEWLKRYAPLAAMGQEQGDALRFTQQQIGLLDALLASAPQVDVDERFERARDQLASFDKIGPADAPHGFHGELRPYQRDGLGWIDFLRSFGFGGCLADDMGLGKTIQVLALLEGRRGSGKPSLVVVPRSLVFNWKQEAERFTPDLRLLNHTGVQRARSAEALGEHDVVLTTYGTLRLDAPFLKDVHFDYVILDEAQAIKNSSTESAKAARLLRADHRLALSGTPIENHIGELWSLFEFLNPGLLGRSAILSGAAPVNGNDAEGRQVLARALRPFILRRTKSQVARELPEKMEQTIVCELDAEQRKLYDELRDHYRATLLDRVAREGLGKSKMQILEALLRLRQCACHPGLIDKSYLNDASAKMEELVPRLAEAADEGHKVLVFSQFTSFLSIVRQRLDAEKVTYEYLDGKTRDREARVNRFQSDDDCKVFLISLRAGGLGLNLTAADYVFLLDPWWNPAVEAQAIDRAHRIGQTRQVFAYRLIAKDTVEEKVLQLQQSKRDLADAIITADNSLIRDLGREDLELLLS